ncbi:hypothetical protein AB6G19_06725 [Providencia manganoxydans]
MKKLILACGMGLMALAITACSDEEKNLKLLVQLKLVMLTSLKLMH